MFLPKEGNQVKAGERLADWLIIFPQSLILTKSDLVTAKKDLEA